MTHTQFTTRAPALLFAAMILVAGLAQAQTTQPSQQGQPYQPAQPGSAGGNLPGPQITFESEAFDFGEIEDGAVVKHTFTFTNTGTKPLIVTEAKTSCGCTVSSFNKDPIAPGAKGEIHAEFNSRGRKGDQSKSVTVKSNDPNRPIVSLSLGGKVTSPDAGEIQMQPMRLDFGLIGSTDFVEQEILIRNVGKKVLTIQGVNGVPTELNAYVDGETSLPVGGSTKVIVTLQAGPRTPGGYYERSVTIRCDDPSKPTMRVPVVAYVRAERGPRLLTVTGEIDVGTIDSANQTLLQIPIMNPGDAPLTIERVQVAGTAIQFDDTSSVSVAPGSSAVLQVRALPNLHKGTFRDRVMIYANDSRPNPQAPSQSLIIFGYVTADSFQPAQAAGGPTTGNQGNAPGGKLPPSNGGQQK